MSLCLASLEVFGGHWRSLVRLIWLIRLIRLIRLDLQWRGRLHSYMLGWMRLDEMVIRGRRSTSTFGANKTLNLIRTMCSTVYFCKIELQCCTVALVSSGCCHQIARLHLIALLVLQVNWPEILIISFCNISYHTKCMFPKRHYIL